MTRRSHVFGGERLPRPKLSGLRSATSPEAEWPTNCHGSFDAARDLPV